MDAERIRCELTESLDEGIDRGIFPGGVASLTIGGEPPVVVARGSIGRGEHTSLPSADTIYDLASLTKVIVTLPLVLLSMQTGKLSLSDPLEIHLPEWERTADARKRRITLLHLLTHTSGLPAWRPYYLLGHGRDDYLSLIAAEPLIGEPGKQVIYSDLGFMLLGFLLERVWDEPLELLAERLIFQPMGMTATGYRPLARGVDIRKIAPTENGNAYEREQSRQQAEQMMAAGHPHAGQLQERLDSFAWREGMIRGTVHDGNCHYGLDGVSGHAGLFSTARDVERYMRMWTSADAPVRLDPVLRTFAAGCRTGRLAPARALGWEASAAAGPLEAASAGCTGGDLLSPDAFGHTGFTGTSIWCDPIRGATLIVLTNRVHPAVSPLMPRWRKAFHNRVMSLVSGPARTS
ncbi:serine hydrolase domain-containing protein [Brevibacillus sedimenti]|jgi:serine-type D-Ala-D-Ala carboxypeptidase|uniref:serine hydrolase domain-containing protein n=1 Tax=Brevibacillus sedimenti TaxID=2613334 RepID=UPI001E4973D4|nr:serine hydrolase domain-containing protein [Anoxybacillus sediminis]UFJ59782.1 beta-lactamase family protein [Anoxybacillus sediminis]